MKVIKWVEWDDDYIKNYPNYQTLIYSKEDTEAVIKALRNNQYKFSGDYHQNGKYGVPILEDGRPYIITCFAWGALILEAYPEEKMDTDSKDSKYIGYKYAYFNEALESEYKYPIQKENDI